MESLFFILPISLVKKIIENIHDNSYHNLRLTCKNFHDLIPYVKSFHSNGGLKSSIKFYMNIPIGSYNYFSDEGYLLKSIPLSSYGIDGVVRYFENFKSYYRCNFIENKKSGIESFNFSDGRLYIETSYRCNLKNGKELTYFKNGSIYAKKYYKNGLLHGETNFYTNNGNSKYTIQFHNNMLNGEVIYYFENSSPFIVCNFKNNKIYGEYKVYYINGNIKMTYNLKDGKIDGFVKIYHHNGTLRDLVKFKNGYPHGIHKSWYNNGKQSIVQKYDNGILHGNKYFFDYQNNVKRNIYHFKYFYGKIIKFTEIKDRGHNSTISFIYNTNNDLIGGKYIVYWNHTEVETDFDKNILVNNYIHRLDMRNNIYYKYYKRRNTNCFTAKKFTDKKFLYSITKINNEYSVFDNTLERNPIKYFTEDLSEINV
jgi:antitoxin component YwqK of YwqJK toxin-antitoxin module